MKFLMTLNGSSFRFRNPSQRLISLVVVAALSLFATQALAGTVAAGALEGFVAGMQQGMQQLGDDLRREAAANEQMERQKRLMEFQYKLERERMERAYQLELEQKERERVAEEHRRDQDRQKRIAAEEQRKRDEAEAKRRAMTTGTGFVVAPGGYLVTNHHVIEDKIHFAVRDYKGRFYKATVIAYDANRDLALLKVASTFPALRVASSDSVSKGQRVMAVGYPQIAIQGNESKVTDGIISSFSGLQNDDNWFQISVPVQGGNSGGPLVTESGAVIGVVVATANASRYFKLTGNLPQNVNYAIKSKVLLDFLKLHNIAPVSAVKGKAGVGAVDASTLLVIAKNDPIEVAYSVSPEQLAREERERAKIAAEESARRRASEAEEKKKAASAAAAEASQLKVAQAEERNRVANQRSLEARDKAIAKSVPNFKDLQSDEVFIAWLVVQTPEEKRKIESQKAQDVSSLLSRFNAERKGFTDGYFQGKGTWIADKNGCLFLNPNPEPNESIVWSGACEAGRGSGPGELIWQIDGVAKQKAKGTYKYGMLNGEGRSEQIGTDAFREGTFKNGNLEGFGRGRSKDGSYYEGEHQKGKMHGRGKLVLNSGEKRITLEGSFVNGRLEGIGRVGSSDGGSYEGNFVNGFFEGAGKQKLADGSVHEGEFRHNRRSGTGRTIFANGVTVDANFVDGKPEGQGKIVWPDGNTYVGELKGGKPNGQGKKTDSKGNTYDGEFKDGKEDGAGTITFVNGKTKAVKMSEGKVVNYY